MNDTELERVFDHLFEGRARARLGLARHGLAQLLATERATIERAVPSRQREYATARVMARELLHELGRGRPALATGPDRAPIWPAGVSGSIAHAEGMCFVAVSTMPTVVALGVDIEPAGPLEPELWGEICKPTELAWIGEQPLAQRGQWARVVFCAKEAFYKCQYAVSRVRLTFSDVSTRIDPAGGRFEARLTIDADPLPVGFGLTGHFVDVDGWLLAAVICTRSDLDGVCGVD